MKIFSKCKTCGKKLWFAKTSWCSGSCVIAGVYIENNITPPKTADYSIRTQFLVGKLNENRINNLPITSEDIRSWTNDK